MEGGEMSDASEVKRWWIEDNEANRLVPPDLVKPRYIEVMAFADHNLILANALKRVFNRQIGYMVSANAFRVLCEEIEKYDPFFKMPNSSERRRFVADRNAEMQSLKQTIARQTRVIEKLREQRNYYCDMAQMPDKSYQEHLEECDAELEAIEQQGEGT